jgi:hypothetical protein
MKKALQSIIIISMIIAQAHLCFGKTLDDNFLFSTVYIENKSTGKNGTGFLTFRRVDEKKSVLYLVSNKHVLMPKPVSPSQTENLRVIATISINTQSSDDIIKVTRDIVLRDDKGSLLVKGHLNPKVDVAGVIITKYFQDIFAKQDQQLLGIPEDRFADKDFLEKNFVSIGVEAIVIGYPLSLVEEGHVISIARGVRIATKPDYDFKRLPVFLVDGTIIRGTSGSPVILPIRPYVWTEKQKINTFEIQENQLVGIISSTIKDWEIVIRKFVANAALEFSVTDNANLGVVFKVETVREVMDLFGFKRWKKPVEDVQPENTADQKERLVD